MLFVAIFIICAAHYVRTLRWEMLIKTYEEPDKKNLLNSLSIGYAVNYFLPFKMGDMVRACVAGHKMQNGYAFSFATVVVDRFLDIITVGILFMIFTYWGKDYSRTSAYFYIYLGAVISLFLLLASVFRKYVKKIIRKLASIFNEKIEFAILKFFWALIWIFHDIFKRIDKRRLLAVTGLMWILYLLSYGCFARFLSMGNADVRMMDIFHALFAKDSVRIGGLGIIPAAVGMDDAGQMVYWLLFLLLPTAFLFLLSMAVRRPAPMVEENEHCLNLIPHLDSGERLQFLEMYFSSEQSAYIRKYLQINRNVLVIRDYSAGSNASTMLCMHNNEQFFRKYAFGKDSDKLYEQIEWIRRFKDILPLPDILRYDRQIGSYCFYDMAHRNNAVGLFEYSHSMPRENAWNYIREMLGCLENSLYTLDQRKADKETIQRYVEEKVDRNIEKIMSARYIKNLMDYEDVYINGHRYKNMKYYLPYLRKEHLYEIFKDDTYSQIHGDLTIENIICTRDAHGKDGFYLIDPNAGNVHASPNLDYAKLLQSLHGGYEFLMAAQNVDVSHNRINFIFTKSETYNYLRSQLDAYMTEHFDRKQIRSIYYHEIVHWLRLMPYKIEKNGKRVLLFYAGMLMVMNDVVNQFERGVYEE